MGSSFTIVIMTKTIFLDIDGCILEHPKDFLNRHSERLHSLNILPGSREKLLEWFCEGIKIILTTGRPECQRQDLISFFSKEGIYHHQLILDCGSGVRCLVNDIDPKDPSVFKALAVNIERNQGLTAITL